MKQLINAVTHVQPNPLYETPEQFGERVYQAGAKVISTKARNQVASELAAQIDAIRLFPRRNTNTKIEKGEIVNLQFTRGRLGVGNIYGVYVSGLNAKNEPVMEVWNVPDYSFNLLKVGEDIMFNKRTMSVINK